MQEGLERLSFEHQLDLAAPLDHGRLKGIDDGLIGTIPAVKDKTSLSGCNLAYPPGNRIPSLVKNRWESLPQPGI